MPTKNQLIKLIEKKEKKEQELRELESRIRGLADDLGTYTVVEVCSYCGEKVLVGQKTGCRFVCRPCVKKHFHVKE
jgi:hypothetical protein